MRDVAQIVEMDAERDRKACIALDLKVAGASRELAQWLIDHPRYSSRVIAGWLGCGYSRVNYLRAWARKDFPGTPFDNKNKPDHGSGQAPLESQDNSEDESDIKEKIEMADPATIEDNVLYTLQRINEHARVFRKLFRASAFDREAKERIVAAIDRTISKWRSTQATLTRKESRHGKT